MQEVDSDALKLVSKILRLSTTGSELTDFQDEVLQQVLSVVPLVRRAGTPPGTTGIFSASIKTTHLGTDTITEDVNPYTLLDATFVGNGYPDPVPADLDVWLLQAYAIVVTGSGDFGGGVLGLIDNALGMGWTNDGLIGVSTRQDIMVWNQETDYANVLHLTDSVSGTTFLNQQGGPQRIKPHANTRIRLRTRKTGAGAASYKVFLTLGVFPASLGQDVK